MSISPIAVHQAPPDDMVVNLQNIGGQVIRDNEQYVLTDNNFLKNLTVSHTKLHPSQATNGHSHEGLEEVYIFTSGHGEMQIGDVMTKVYAGTIVNIPAGDFHRVFNRSLQQPLEFVAIFQKYDRGASEGGQSLHQSSCHETLQVQPSHSASA